MKGSGSGKKRGLSGEDRALWNEIVKSIKPLPGRRTKSGHEPEALAIEDQIAKGAETRNRPVTPAPLAKRQPAPLAPMDRRLKQKLSRGSAGIDARLDLHGHTQAEARSRLLRFLEAAQAREQSLVLVITGKGKRSEEDWSGAGGVLKRQVPLWLSLPEFRPLVIGFEEASIRHGGAGALYIRVRRRR